MTTISDLLNDPLYDVDQPRDDGLSALQAAALHGSPALLERALARSADLSRPIAAPYALTCEGCVPDDGGFVPKLILPAGFTALDMVEQAAGIYATLHGAYGKKGHFAPLREKRIA